MDIYIYISDNPGDIPYMTRVFHAQKLPTLTMPRMHPISMAMQQEPRQWLINVNY